MSTQCCEFDEVDQVIENKELERGTVTHTEQTKGNTGVGKSLYFKDPFTDMAFLHTLALHGFKGSEIVSATWLRPRSERETSRVGERRGVLSRNELRGLREVPRVRAIELAPASPTARRHLPTQRRVVNTGFQSGLPGHD